MSLLLDALKKSEEQRRLGAQPDIHREAAPTPQSDAATARLWLPLALVVVAVLAISWLGWRQFRAPEPATAVAEVADATLPAPAMAERPDSAAGDAATPGARTPIESFTAPEPQTAAADTPAPADPAAMQARQQARQSFSEYKEPETPPASAAATSPAPDVPASSAPAPKPAPKPAAAASPAAQPTEPYEPEPMSYWALPQGVRDTLPAFRVSVLVYADDPADRFVLVNGVRLREKQELQTGVVLDEIRRDGAVFRARNYRFLVKG